MVSFEDFKKLEIVVARIESVRDHPNADKLLILEVNVGDGSGENRPASGNRKEIVAGIKDDYSKEELIGKNIVMVNNLQSLLIRGVESSGMLLAAQDENGISLIMPDRPVKPGSKVK